MAGNNHVQTPLRRSLYVFYLYTMSCLFAPTKFIVKPEKTSRFHPISARINPPGLSTSWEHIWYNYVS